MRDNSSRLKALEAPTKSQGLLFEKQDKSLEQTEAPTGLIPLGKES